MLTILLINDNNLINKILKKRLEKYDFSVDVAETGEQGLEKIKENTYQIILLDYKLPGIWGDEVCKKVKNDEKTKNIPVLYISSADKEVIEKLIQDTGAQGYMDIAGDEDKMIEQIKSLINA